MKKFLIGYLLLNFGMISLGSEKNNSEISGIIDDRENLIQFLSQAGYSAQQAKIWIKLAEITDKESKSIPLTSSERDLVALEDAGQFKFKKKSQTSVK